MVTLTKYTRIGGGEVYNRNVLWIEGLSSTFESKPTTTFIEYDGNGKEVARMPIENGSVYSEIDTGKTYKYDAANATWYEFAVGGGGGTSGGIVLVGETTTQLTDNATTNPITIDGQSYTAQPNDAVIYGSKEFLFDGTKWHEFGDLSGLSSKDIGAMTNYTKAQTAAAIATTDTLNQAVGKLEYKVDVKQNEVLGSWTAGTATSHSTPSGADTVLQALEKIDNNQRLDETNISSLQQAVGYANTELEGVL